VLFSQPEADGAAQRKSTGSVSFRLEPRSGSLDGLDERDVLLAWTDGRNADIGTSGIPVLSDGVWTVPVSGIDAEGTVTVTLSRNGYEFNPASIKNVPVHYAKPVTLAVTPADGDELLGIPTTKLTLAFDEPVANLGLDEITVTDPNGTGAKPGELKPVSGTNNYNYTLAVSGITKSGTIGVTVAKGGYDVTGADGNAAVSAKVYDSAQNPLATGGSTVKVTKESNGYYETHTFTSTTAGQALTFTNSVPAGLKAEVLVVGGGGGGGKSGDSQLYAGGGGGGGVIIHSAYSLTATSYNVTVGGGGSAATSIAGSGGDKGVDSKFGTDFTAIGGGGGGSHGPGEANAGRDGGSGGGGCYMAGGGATKQTNAPAGATTYGRPGGGVAGIGYSGGGGGGAGGAGGAPTGERQSALGGSGISSSITGTAAYYGGGGAAGGGSNPDATYGASGGASGTANTGDGGGGGCGGQGGNGGSGIVVVRFPIPSVQ
jgi:hypothetical protein